MNVWLPGLLGDAIDEAVDSGRFNRVRRRSPMPSRPAFFRKERNVVT